MALSQATTTPWPTCVPTQAAARLAVTADLLGGVGFGVGDCDRGFCDGELCARVPCAFRADDREDSANATAAVRITASAATLATLGPRRRALRVLRAAGRGGAWTGTARPVINLPACTGCVWAGGGVLTGGVWAAGGLSGGAVWAGGASSGGQSWTGRGRPAGSLLGDGLRFLAGGAAKPWPARERICLPAPFRAAGLAVRGASL